MYKLNFLLGKFIQNIESALYFCQILYSYSSIFHLSMQCFAHVSLLLILNPQNTLKTSRATAAFKICDGCDI